jgi:hypothetical protein
MDSPNPPRDPGDSTIDDDLLASAIPIDDDSDDASPEAAADADEAELAPIEIDAAAPASGRQIQTFDNATRHEDNWDRTPNVTGAGAIHVKTFVAKLRLDAVEHLDQQINEWLDSHPEYEVKFTSSTIGKLVGKNTEDALFVNVWV